MDQPVPLLIRNARVLTLDGSLAPRRTRERLNDLGVVPRADVLVNGERIDWIRPVDSPAVSVEDVYSLPDRTETLDADGRVLMPAFVDCHTHACYTGSRLDEWEMKLAGASYLDILRAGGGIMSTVRAVRAATQAQLAEELLERLTRMAYHGTGSVEVKSGYGLTTADELKMLRAIQDAAARFPGTVVPTALLGHALDPDQPGFLQTTINETLPAVAAEFPGITVDAYCERGAWLLEACLELFDRAAAVGCPCRVHADQFNDLGMIPEAVRRSFVSVDHLEASSRDRLELLARSQTFGVMLPLCGLHLDGRYADARSFVDFGGALCIGTNLNPGSAPGFSMPLAIAVANRSLGSGGERKGGITAAEAICAATVNPASLLGLPDRGRVAPGARADLLLLAHRDERMLAYELGANPVDAVVIGGVLFHRSPGLMRPRPIK